MRHVIGLYVGVVLLNVLGWGALLAVTPPLDSEIPDVYTPRPPPDTSGGMSVVVDRCSHCPQYVLWNRGVIGDSPIVFEALARLNGPALWAASGKEVRHRIKVVTPWAFVLAVLTQWMIVATVLVVLERMYGVLRTWGRAADRTDGRTKT